MIPEHLRNFLRTTIKSVWALDLLVLLRSSPSQAWTTVTLNNRLRASTSLVEEILVSFTRHGLVTVEADGTYRYARRAPRSRPWRRRLHVSTGSGLLVSLKK